MAEKWGQMHTSGRTEIGLEVDCGREIFGSSLFPMGEQTKSTLSFGGFDRSWASSRDESLRERLRLIVSARGFLGPAHRRQVIAVCDQQTPAPYTGDDQSEGCSNVSPLGETD